MYSTSIMAGAMAFVFHLTAMNEITKSSQKPFSCPFDSHTIVLFDTEVISRNYVQHPRTGQ